MYKKVLLFAGTTEGRELCRYLEELSVPAVVYVTTEYGEQLLETDSPDVQVKVGKLDEEDMEAEFDREKPELVIDATHPYAVLASKNIEAACKARQLPYVRVIRESKDSERAAAHADNMEQAADWLNAHADGNILVTTGSKELPQLIGRIKDTSRLIVRILPNSSMLAACERLGLEGRQMICMQGPFSEEMNYLMMKEKQIRYLLTKESGVQGGFEEKLLAAERAGVKTVVIRRPQEENGYSTEQIAELLRKGQED